VTGLIILKLGTKTGMPVSYAGDKLHFNLNYFTVGGIVLYGISFALYTYLISKFDLGYIIPLAAAFVYILIFVGSYFVFKEAFTTAKLIGISLIVGGLIFLNLGK
jgi:drug/metabolite transporter (DMT)-like permease